MLLAMENPIAKQRAWLRRILAALQISPTALARKAGVVPTTLTRFLNDEDWPYELKPRTIRQIESVSGMALDGKHPEHGFREDDAAPYQADGVALWDNLIRQAIGTANGTDPWVLQSFALEQAGYLPGDILLVDMNAKPQTGDVVCAQRYEWNAGKAHTIFRIYEPPFLIAATSASDLRKPFIVDNENVIVRGVVVGSVRPRPKRRAA